MATYIVNGTIQDASTAQDAVAAGNGLNAVVIQAIGGDLRVNVGADAERRWARTLLCKRLGHPIIPEP